VELPRIEKFHQAYKSKGLVSIGVTCNHPRETVLSFGKKMGVTFHLTVNPSPPWRQNPFLLAYGVTQPSTTILIGPDGRVAYSELRFDDDDLRKALERLGIR
jgi:hypothetical protein